MKKVLPASYIFPRIIQFSYFWYNADTVAVLLKQPMKPTNRGELLG